VPYVDATTVKTMACCKYEDLGLADDAAFTTLVNTLISWATGEMDTYMGRHYTDADITADTTGKLSGGLSSVCFQAVDNYLLSTIQRRQAPIININEFVVKNPPRIILTRAMKETLEGIKSDGLPYPEYYTPTRRFDHTETDLIYQGNDATSPVDSSDDEND